MHLGRTRIRRLTALLLALCLGMFSAETLVADVHDGDSSSAASHVEELGGPVDGHSLPGGVSHSVHVCHCVHGHGGAPPVHNVATAAPVEHPRLLTSSDSVPNDVGPEPHVRPPIA